MGSRTRSVLLAAVVLLALTATVAGAQVTGEIVINQNRQAGTHRDSGALLMYTPDPNQPGSSVSHWDTSATPNLLMEPAINPDLPFLGLDVTPGLMSDIGWPLTGEPNAPGPVTFNIFALDPPGTGFTDPRPFGGAPGNPATTLGEARVNLIEAVLDTWGTALASDVPVDVLVTWQPLPCAPGLGAVLAAAGPLSIFADDQGALPVDNTWYAGPLAEALVGQDLTGAPADNGGDIIVFINSDLDNECLGAGTSYYYGLDGNDPANQIDLAPVVLHELGHGLGFTTFTDDETGEEFQGLPSIYDVYLRDEDAGETWPQMNDAQRRMSAINYRDLTWIGPDANALAAPYLEFGVPELQVSAPAGVAGSYEIGPASFGGDIPAAGLGGDIACLIDAPELPNDGGLGTILDGCSSAENPGDLAGRIALIDRGGCSFVDKARHAQDAGAIGAIIVNNAGNVPPGLGGSDPAVTIPVVSLGADDGNRIRQAACPSQSAYLHDRFQVTVQWNRQRPGLPADMGDGHGVQITNNTAWFYFVRPDNPQLMVKIVNACGLEHPAWWVFSGGVTAQEVFITVTDTTAGTSKTYHNPAGVPFRTTLDTGAFENCP